MMKYTNPITLYNEDQRENAGDPFVLKYDGNYFLYVSSEADQQGIRCYQSNDLINWEFKKIICDESITKNAYAPEVIFFKGKFILATSPGGNGHYIYEAKHPLGPFKRMTGNVKNMIDGSFYKEDGKLYFLRANHSGIALLEVTEDYRFINRVDLDAEMHGWTEGPFLIKRKGIYYLTYCGNNLFADTYRVDYSYATNLKGPYIKGKNNSIINKLNSTYHSLGHSSVIKGPNLDTYYNVYHKLTKTDSGSIRDYCIDRLDFFEHILKQNLTDKPQIYPVRPTFESYKEEHINKFKLIGDYCLTKDITNREFVSEFNIIGNDINIIFGYSFHKHYELKNHVHGYAIYEIKNDEVVRIDDFNATLNNDCINKIEIRQKDRLEIIFNDQLVLTLDMLINGRLGFKEKELNRISYIAYNNNVYQNVQGVQKIPNLVFLNDETKTVKPICKGNQLDFTVEGKNRFYLSALIHVIEPLELRVNGKIIQIDMNLSDYLFNKEFLTIIEIKKEKDIHIDVLKGNALFKYLELEQIDYEMLHIKKKDILLQETMCMQTLTEHAKQFSTAIKVIQKNFRSRFGMLINVSQFSEFSQQAQYPFNGYFIGFYQDLLVVDRVNFGIKRIYDVPYNLSKDTCELSVTFERNKITVLVDQVKIIECYDSMIKNTGYLGTYSDELSEIEFTNTLGGIINV